MRMTAACLHRGRCQALGRRRPKARPRSGRLRSRLSRGTGFAPGSDRVPIQRAEQPRGVVHAALAGACPGALAQHPPENRSFAGFPQPQPAQVDRPVEFPADRGQCPLHPSQSRFWWDRKPLATRATLLALRAICRAIASPPTRYALRPPSARHPASESLLRRPGGFTYRIGTTVPHSSSSLASACARVPVRIAPRSVSRCL